MSGPCTSILSGIGGIIVGSIIVLTIQFTIGNPFMWLDEKYQDWKSERKLKRKQATCPHYYTSIVPWRANRGCSIKKCLYCDKILVETV